MPEARTEERLWKRVFEPLLAVLIGLVLLAFVGYSVWNAWKAPALSVAAPFTRVGGEARIDTALEVSRFWHGEKSNYVRLGVAADLADTWPTVECAFPSRDDREAIPLLYGPPGSGNDENAEMVSRLGGKEKDCSRSAEPPGGSKECEETRHWSVFEATRNDQQVPSTRIAWPDWVPKCKVLHPTVIVASSKTTTDAPDVALALILADKMADKQHPVSVLIIPAYLEADPLLEDELRSRRAAVKGGVVIGSTLRIPEETSKKLRSVLVQRSSTLWADKLQSGLQPLQAVILGLLGLWGLKQLPKAVPLIEEGVGTVRGRGTEHPGGAAPVGAAKERSRQVTKPERSTRFGRRLSEVGSKRGDAVTDPWSVWALRDANVTVQLQSGIAWSARLSDPPSDVCGVLMLPLRDARRVPGEETDDKQSLVLIRWDEVSTLARQADSRAPDGAPEPSAGPPQAPIA